MMVYIQLQELNVKKLEWQVYTAKMENNTCGAEPM